jgi:hypothetical protein
VVQPIVAFIDKAREHDDRQIVVLIPVVVPEHLRYRILHNQIDHVLSAALRTRTDVVVARVRMPLQVPSSAVADAPVVASGTGVSEKRGTGPMLEPPG